MSRYRKNITGLVAAMESEDDFIVESPEVIGDNVDSVETRLLDVNECQREMDVADDAIDDAIDVAGALESIAEQLRISANFGGIDQTSAGVVRQTTDYLYRRAGHTPVRILQPSLESFNPVSTRAGATTLAMEEIKNNIAKIWEKIIAVLKKWIQWGKDFINKVVQNAEGVQKRATALAAKTVPGEPKVREYEEPRLASMLYIGNAVPSDISASTGRLVDISKQVFSDTASYFGEMGEDILKGLEAPDAAGSFINDISLTPPTNIPYLKRIPNPESDGFDQPPEGLALYRSDELPGGMAILIRGVAERIEGEKAVQVLDALGGGVEKFKPNAKAPENKVVPVLTLEQKTKVAEDVAEIAKVIIAYQASSKKLEAVKERALAVAEKAMRDAGAAGDDSKPGFRALEAGARAFPRWVDQPAVRFSVYLLNVCKALLDDCEESMKQFA